MGRNDYRHLAANLPDAFTLLAWVRGPKAFSGTVGEVAESRCDNEESSSWSAPVRSREREREREEALKDSRPRASPAFPLGSAERASQPSSNGCV